MLFEKTLNVDGDHYPTSLSPMAACRRCKSKDLVTDDVTGDTVCANCGVVQDFDNFQHNYGGISGPQGTFVRLGTSGAGTDYSYKDRKLLEANRIIEDITFRLNFSGATTRAVKTMVEKVTEGEFGLGNWFSVLVGACCYIVMRQNNKSLPINDVIGVVGCELYEMGKMVNRVVDFLELQLPEFDVVGLLDRMIRGFSGFSGVDEDKKDLMIKQGNFVIQCAIKWFLTTGRRPGPVAVSVLVFVAALNGFKVRIEDVAREMNLGVATCRTRYKELLEAFVEVAQGLPWGKDVNVKNIVNNAPFVIKYMEMKSIEKKGDNKKRGFEDGSDKFNLENVVEECLGREADYCIDSDRDRDGNCLAYSITGEDHDGFWEPSISDLENQKISYKDLAKIYSKFKADVANRNLMNGNEIHHCGNRPSGEDLQLFDEWWSGRSALCQKLLLEQLLEKDVGRDALPPSYISGCLAVKRRREKIRAAKLRINSIICSSNDSSSDKIISSRMDAQSYSGNEIGASEYVKNHKKRKKQCDDIDGEDFIIETLLLHQVNEEEIEKGHYNALLGLHVFKSGVI